MTRALGRPFHHNSVIGDGVRQPLTRDQRAKFKYLLHEHGRLGRLPAKQERVGEALIARLSTDGRCDPAHDRLAADARCSARTVRRAIVRLRELNLLVWERRLVQRGSLLAQTSSQYRLLIPGTGSPAFSPARSATADSLTRESGCIENTAFSLQTPVFPWAGDNPAVARAALARIAAERQGVVDRQLQEKSRLAISQRMHRTFQQA